MSNSLGTRRRSQTSRLGFFVQFPASTAGSCVMRRSCSRRAPCGSFLSTVARIGRDGRAAQELLRNTRNQQCRVFRESPFRHPDRFHLQLHPRMLPHVGVRPNSEFSERERSRRVCLIQHQSIVTLAVRGDEVFERSPLVYFDPAASAGSVQTRGPRSTVARPSWSIFTASPSGASTQSGHWPPRTVQINPGFLGLDGVLLLLMLTRAPG